MLDFKYSFLLKILIALARSDQDMLRTALFESISEICDLSQKKLKEASGIQIKDKEAEFAKKSMQSFLMALSTIVTGMDIDILSLVKDSIKELDSEAAHNLYLASRGDIRGIDTLLNKLGLHNQKKMMTEFSHILLEKRYKLKEISRRLGFPKDQSEAIYSIMGILILVSKYTHKVDIVRKAKAFKECNKDIDPSMILINEADMVSGDTEVFIEKTKRRLDELISNGAIRMKELFEYKLLSKLKIQKYQDKTFDQLQYKSSQEIATVIAQHLAWSIRDNRSVKELLDSMLNE